MPINEDSAIVIRDIEHVSELHACEELQKEVWGIPELDVVPLSHLVAVRAAGGVLIGAFDGKTLIGFVYGFLSHEYGQMAHHSHMLAVKPAYRNLNLGYKLKLAQRDRVVAQGITLMTWTFDPLQSLNAYFNFNKLGVLADQYKVDFYGADASSFLHRNGTDRLWVAWLLASRRVNERLDSPGFDPDVGKVTPMVQLQPDDSPHRSAAADGLSQDNALIEIPGDINALQERSVDLPFKWREATRWAFTEAIAAGYLVVDFCRRSRGDQPVGAYLLSRKKKLADFI